MNCELFKDRLDDYTDAALPQDEARALEQHGARCPACKERLAHANTLGGLLRDYARHATPSPEAEFFELALARAAHQGARQQRNRWLMTGFGGAMAAGLAVLIMGGLLTQQPLIAPPAPGLPSVSMALAEPHTVRLLFSATEPLPDATLTVLLPPGVELAGFPGQREVRWETSLQSGKNLLPLTLIATTRVDAEVHAVLQHGADQRTFRLRIMTTQGIPG